MEVNPRSRVRRLLEGGAAMSRAMRAVPIVVLCALIIAVPSVWAYWVQDGVALCTATGDQWVPAITSDDAGGAIVAWYEERSGIYYDIYTQRVNSSGTVQWAANGVALCTATNDQQYLRIISDGAGGAIVTWQDFRSGTNWHVYAQRVNASGTVLWTTNGVPLCTAAGDHEFPTITSDGAGGAIVTWLDNRNGNYDIYAQRVNYSGTVEWAANGVALCTATHDQMYPKISFDQGGAIVTWQDYRSGSNWDVYAQKVNPWGTVQWTENGVNLCTSPDDELNPQITSDGFRGAIVTWWDGRNVEWDIYAQKVNSSGTVQWVASGVALCTAPLVQSYPTIISDGGGGAFVTWQDSRSGFPDIYAQRVDASGATRWAANGLGLCTATGDQAYPGITSDGAGGAIVTWQDNRTRSKWTCYAQQVSSSGKIGFLAPALHSVRDVPGDQGGHVNLAWDASRADYLTGDITRYTIWRALSTPAALIMVENGAALLSGPEQVSSTTSKPQVRMQQLGGRTFYWSLIDSHDAYYLQNYSKIVATAFDSSSATTQYNYFQIIAHTSDARTFFVSTPDSARSVDNIAPSPPASLAGEQSYTPAGLYLTWDRNTEADLGHYAVYRGTSAGFVPGPGNLIASPSDTTLLDGGWCWSSGYYYKVSAVDVHDNQSGFALLTPDGVTGTDTPKAREASYLSQNYPNPFNPTTRIAFGLKEPAIVSLRIYDAAGRLVRVLVESSRPAGAYAELWDGRDSSGRSVSSGIYFYRLNAGTFESTKKMILLR
jgi:predicted lipoprotein with Yx(FWY)xxD motif